MDVNREPLSGVEQFEQNPCVGRACSLSRVPTNPGFVVCSDQLLQGRAVKKPGQARYLVVLSTSRGPEPLFGLSVAAGGQAPQCCNALPSAVLVIDEVGCSRTGRFDSAVALGDHSVC
jgi:hypothetical protein